MGAVAKPHLAKAPLRMKISEEEIFFAPAHLRSNVVRDAFVRMLDQTNEQCHECPRMVRNEIKIPPSGIGPGGALGLSLSCGGKEAPEGQCEQDLRAEMWAATGTAYFDKAMRSAFLTPEKFSKEYLIDPSAASTIAEFDRYHRDHRVDAAAYTPAKRIDRDRPMTTDDAW